jgi:hypothetical protein
LRIPLGEQNWAEDADGPTKVLCVTATWWRTLPGRNIAGPPPLGLLVVALWLGMACWVEWFLLV